MCARNMHYTRIMTYIYIYTHTSTCTHTHTYINHQLSLLVVAENGSSMSKLPTNPCKKLDRLSHSQFVWDSLSNKADSVIFSASFPSTVCSSAPNRRLAAWCRLMPLASFQSKYLYIHQILRRKRCHERCFVCRELLQQSFQRFDFKLWANSLRFPKCQASNCGQ